jgi:glucose/arabinose dehydrogenase
MDRWPVVLALGLAAAPAGAATLTGAAAYGDWRTDAPGVTRKITPADIKPLGGPIGVAPSSNAPRPAGAEPKVPPGFTVAAFAKLQGPRLIRIAPNGDIFVAETGAGRVKVLRAADGAAAPSDTQTFADGLDRPFGIAFYPAGANPKWVYVANANSVVRFAYQSGDLRARGPAQTVVAKLAANTSTHFTRDVVFSADGRTMFISVGSGSNVGEEVGKKTPDEVKAWQAGHALGADWGNEEDRADVLTFDPEGGGRRVFAAGIRNCVGMAINPTSKDLWCAVNERDLIGDDLPPEYVTRVHQGAFYGWPWYYIGDHPDPRRKDERPDLAGKVTVPDVLLQPHSAPLEMTFYEATSGVAAFPTAYRGSAFVALHGSWNRAKRTGYKVVRLPMKGGAPSGEYEDFLTGFVVDDRSVWGRPVGVAVAHDGALLVSDDGGDTVWRVAYAKH